MGSETFWISCKVLKGMLPGEVTILVSTAENEELSLFVPETHVRLCDGTPVSEIDGVAKEGRVRVDVVDHDDSFNLVALPGEPFGGSRFARVTRNQVTC